MSTVTKEIMNLARKAGYEGEDKKNVTKAIDALADTLAGEDLEQATNVAAAIRKLQPYINSGGGDGEVTSYTLENYSSIDIVIPDDTTLQEYEVDAWVDGRIESWINGQIDDDSVKFTSTKQGNLIPNIFHYLFDKNYNFIAPLRPPSGAPAVGGGLVINMAESVFLATTFEKEGINDEPHMFHLSPEQDGYHHMLYAIRTEYGDNDLLVPLEVVDKFDVEDLIDDTIIVTIPEEEAEFPIPLVKYPSLNSPLSLDDFAATGFNLEQIVEPRIVLCDIFILFDSK